MVFYDQSYFSFSGGLDSILAVELIRRQKIDVLGLTFTTPFLTIKKHNMPQSY